MENSKYYISKGMLMHPFSDQSGVTFFNTLSTVISSVNVPLSEFYEWLNNPSELDEEKRHVLSQLHEQGFIALTK